MAAGLAAWIGEPAPAVVAAAGEVTALTVGQWLHDRAEGLRIVDLRAAEEYSNGRLPRAERFEAAALSAAPFAEAGSVVVYAADDALAARAAESLRSRGVDALVLRGGYTAWVDDVLAPEIPAGAGDREPWRSRAELSRYFGGRPRVAGAPARTWRGC